MELALQKYGLAPEKLSSPLGFNAQQKLSKPSAYGICAVMRPVHTCSRKRRLCIRKQAILLSFRATSLPETANLYPETGDFVAVFRIGYKVSCFGNKCGQAFSLSVITLRVSWNRIKDKFSTDGDSSQMTVTRMSPPHETYTFSKIKTIKLEKVKRLRTHAQRP